MIGILLTPLLKKIREKLKINSENIIYKTYEIIRTGLFVTVGMMLFRSHSLKTFFNSFVNIFKRSNSNIFSFGLETFDYIILIIYVVALLIIGILQEKNKNIY